MKRFGLLIFMIPSLAVAGGAVFNMKDGERVRIHCSDGAIKKQTSGSTVEWLCVKTGTQPPKPEPTPPPSVSCPPPTLPLNPSNALPLPQQEFVAVYPNRSRVYYFDSNNYRNREGRISVAPSPAAYPKVSDNNMAVLSECPGFMDIDVRDSSIRACWGSGIQADIRWRVGNTTRNVCGVKADRRYFINVAPRNAINGKPTVSPAGGVVVNSDR